MFSGTLVWVIMRRRQPDDEPVTEAWEFGPSGMTWPVPITNEDGASIEYDIRYSKGMDPVHRQVSHSHPFNPVGTAQRVFLVPQGSTAAIDPRTSFELGQDRDDPGPIIQAAASWYKRLQDALGSAGLKLRENWFTLLILAVMCFGLGIIVEAKFLLVPAVPGG